MGVNGIAAANTLLGYGGVRHGLCLYYVWQAYKAHGARTGMSSPTAYDAWLKSSGKHEGDRNPPAGVPVFWGPKSGSSAGDVVISLGGGRVVATDYPVYGQVNITTIDARERQIGRPYLGWTERIFDAAIDFDRDAVDGGTTASQDTKNRQAWLNKSRGEKLDVDGIQGGKTTAAIKRYQKFIGVTADGIWGSVTQNAHQKYYDEFHGKGAAKPSNPFGIGYCAGLQKIANLYGGGTSIDQIWGAKSAAGFAQFLRANWGYKGNDVLGPNMWAAIARWLRSNWGYKGNDVPGPVMRAALQRAETANYREL